MADLAVQLYGPAFPLDWLITIFFITYVIFSFASSRLVEERGLRTGVLIGTALICSCDHERFRLLIIIMNFFFKPRYSFLEFPQVPGAKQ